MKLCTCLGAWLVVMASSALAQTTSLEQAPFYQQVMMAPSLLPSDLSNLSTECPVRQLPTSLRSAYRSAEQTNYDMPGWEQRLAADWSYLPIEDSQGRITIIDVANAGDSGPLLFRYLANDNSQHSLYEPWSSSKVMAITAAMKTLRVNGLSANSHINGLVFADLATSIHSYLPFGSADGDSNAIASYFANLSGRARLARLFGDDWLKLSDPKIGLRGAYNQRPLNPGPHPWVDGDRQKAIDTFATSAADPNYQTYRCDTCGKLGNKPMTTLAEAEWLKRLATASREPLTQLPGLSPQDLATLFWGQGHSDQKEKVGGMLQGIGHLVPKAVHLALGGKPQADGKQIKSDLDQVTDGRWRIYHKVGWGYSETRSAAEVVMLAHVCLPEVQGGREFTLAAQVGIPATDESQLSQAGKQLLAVMAKGISSLLD